MRIVEKGKLWGLSITFLEWTSLQTQEKACNPEESKDDHVFVQGGWVEFNEWVINETLRDMVVEDDEFEKFMTEKLDIKCLVAKLCRKPYEMSWRVCEKEQYLHFNSNAMVPMFIPLLKFICSRIIPTKLKANATVDRAVLLFCIVKGVNSMLENWSMVKFWSMWNQPRGYGSSPNHKNLLEGCSLDWTRKRTGVTWISNHNKDDSLIRS